MGHMRAGLLQAACTSVCPENKCQATVKEELVLITRFPAIFDLTDNKINKEIEIELL
jgi:hypothetical protein